MMETGLSALSCGQGEGKEVVEEQGEGVGMGSAA